MKYLKQWLMVMILILCSVYAIKAGEINFGHNIISPEPTSSTHLATKNYIDNHASSSGMHATPTAGWIDNGGIINPITANDIINMTGGATTTSISLSASTTPYLAGGIPVNMAEANYIVQTMPGGLIYVTDGFDGSIDYSGTDPETVIEWAMNNLTAGRTWKEKVVVKGNYSIDTSIDVPSYTILELNGKLTITAGTYGIINSDTVGGNTEIEIVGGEIDGNYDSLALTNNCVAMTNVTNLKVENMRIYDCHNEGIELRGSSGFVISGNIISNNSDDSISILDLSNKGSVTNNVCYGNRSITGSSSGIEVEDGSYQVAVFGNNIYGGTTSSSMAGIAVVVDPAGSFGAPHDVAITGNSIRDVELRGINIQTNLASADIDNISIVGNTISYTGSHGISLYGKTSDPARIRGTSIIGNSIKYTGQSTNVTTSPASIDGIYLTLNVGTFINGNSVSESGKHGIHNNSSEGTSIVSNIVFNNGNTDTTSAYGIAVRWASSTRAFVSGNYIYDNQATKTQDGIVVYANAGTTTPTRIIDNNIVSVRANTIALQATSYAYIANNLGYTLTQTIGAGTTIDPFTNYMRLSCDSGATPVLAESLKMEGHRVMMTNVSANTCTFSDQAGILVLKGGTFVLGADASLELVYEDDQWVEVGRNSNFGSASVSSTAKFSGDRGSFNSVTATTVGVVTSTPGSPLSVVGNANITGAIKAGGGSAGKAMCWKADGLTLGYCSSVVAADGSCTCN